ncbi:MAG: FliM/FliN family flagellar motor switch protein [Myxococcota bacterium]
MSEAEAGILSRDELAALLDAIANEGGEETPWPRKRPAPPRKGPIARALSGFAEEQTRLLSTLHQRSLRFSVFAYEPLGTAEFAGSMLPEDLAIVFEMQPSGERGLLVVSRAFFYGWLTIALGGANGVSLQVPSRGYSSVEQRFLRILGTEICQQLGRSLREFAAVDLRVDDVVGPELLGDDVPSRLYVASLDVAGFDEVARLRIGLPSAWVESFAAPAGKSGAPGHELAAALRETPIAVHAEIGHADLGLRRIAALQVGDTLTLDPVPGGEVLVRLEDRPKFRAVRGAIGSRLAVRVVGEV